MEYSKEELIEIRNKIDITDVESLMAELGGEPRYMNGALVSQTICHCGASHKLYYYDNTKLFKCYTECGDTFDIYELVKRRMNSIGETKLYYSREGKLVGRKWELFDAIDYVLSFFHIQGKNDNFSKEREELQDWKYIDKIAKNSNVELKQKRTELKIYNDEILFHLPKPIIKDWIDEGISKEVMDYHHIAYDPVKHGIVIPHYDLENNLIGIRERTLVKEEEIFGKYKPAIFGGQMYNHPLGFNLYNLNFSKENINKMGVAIVFEGEKSPLLYASYFGKDNDISVAVCGFNIIEYQIKLLLSCGAKEIVIAFDKQFQDINDEEGQRLVKKLYTIHNKYGGYVQISYLFDKYNRLDYKDSPIDKGKETFLSLFKERIML